MSFELMTLYPRALRGRILNLPPQGYDSRSLGRTSLNYRHRSGRSACEVGLLHSPALRVGLPGASQASGPIGKRKLSHCVRTWGCVRGIDLGWIVREEHQFRAAQVSLRAMIAHTELYRSKWLSK